MLGWFRRKSLLGDELSAWQFDCCQWLLRHTGGFPALRESPMVQPTPRFFPDRGLRGTAMADAIFARVKGYAGMGTWPCELHMQEDDPDAKVGPTLLVQNTPHSPAGTFRKTDAGALITYHPRQLDDPMSLVATFAHELAHYLTGGATEPPPGGWEVWEHATDMGAVFLGFGIFMANSRFNFSQYSDGQVMGWKWRQQGYVSEPEILHMHAIRCALLGTPPGETLAYLKPSLRGIFKRVLADVQRQNHVLQELRGVAPLMAEVAHA